MSGIPPALYMSVAMKRPPGFKSASSGVRELMRSKSSISSAIPASCAIASRCSTALVEPPVIATDAIAFSIAFLVMIWLGRKFLFSRSTASCPAWNATSGFFGSVAGMLFEAHRRDAEKFGRRRHRVGGELAAARANSGTGNVFETLQVLGFILPAEWAPTASNTS